MVSNVIKGSAYTINIQPGWPGAARSEGYGVWIDYNKNGSFADAGELVYTRSRTTATTVGSPITIPTTAITGTVRMRVSMRYNSTPNSCDIGLAGEVEDYTLNIMEPFIDVDAPTAPTLLTAGTVTHNSVALTWNASTDNLGVSGYRIYANGSLQLSVTTNSATVTGLTPSTLYSFYVIAFDAAGNISSASNIADVTTQPFVVTYCASSGTSTSREFINRVSIGNINNLSGNNNGYGNFTTQSTTLINGSIQTITITPGWTAGGAATATAYGSITMETGISPIPESRYSAVTRPLHLPSPEPSRCRLEQ